VVVRALYNVGEAADLAQARLVVESTWILEESAQEAGKKPVSRPGGVDHIRRDAVHGSLEPGGKIDAAVAAEGNGYELQTVMPQAAPSADEIALAGQIWRFFFADLDDVSPGPCQ
jgi:hypothetical protein